MFPAEIFGEIFSFLASDARVLVACSQAHPTFAQLIEPILYAHVIVHNRNVDDEDEDHLKLNPYQLSTALSGNPRVQNHLRSLSVELSWICSNDEVMKEMTPILPRLKLERIKLTFAPSVISVDWESFPIAFRTAFVACISTPSMKEICLDGISNTPLSSFSDCAGLKRLMLADCAVPPSNISCNLPLLEDLELSFWTMDDSRLFSSMLTHASGLRSLTFTTFKKEAICGFLPHFLTTCSTSLVNLSIYYFKPIPLGFDVAPNEIDFPGLPSLERLRLCTYFAAVEYPQNTDNNPVRYALITIAQILQNFSSLKHLTLIIGLRFVGEDVTQVDWSPLANFLSHRHPSFRHTDLYIHVMKGKRKISSDEVISMLSRYENLMNLMEAGYISIQEELDMHVSKVLDRLRLDR